MTFGCATLVGRRRGARRGRRMTAAVLLFTAFGLASQLLLVAFFAARRWAPPRADVIGRVAYTFAATGLAVGVWLALDGQSYRLFTGPILLAAWAALGATVDVVRPRPWRGPPIEWRVMGPYVGLYFFSQMFLWWPLWELARGAWLAFGILFAVNTALNLRGHVQASRQPHR
jgi:hypothetical protein